MESRGVECEVCGTPTVVRVRRDSPGVEVWRCARCGDAKRWCPECDQGWVRRRRLGARGAELYSCDECDATWAAPEEIAPPGAGLTAYLRARGVEYRDADLVTVREVEPVPPVV